MTDDEWLVCTDAAQMIRAIVDLKVSDRKYLQFSVACLRSLTTSVREVLVRREIAERWAEGRVAVSDVRKYWGGPEYWPEHPRAWAVNLIGFCPAIERGSLVNTRRNVTADYLRDIIGNPFHPAPLDQRWRSSTVLDLARTIYDERAFECLPILADALMDAGCDCDEIIKHCHSDGPHVRGCWVVDLLLGKE